MIKPINISRIMMGCDPEFFFEKNGEILGSEKVISRETGLSVPSNIGLDGSIGPGKDSKIIVDGVQAELNPRPDNCRARLGNEISRCFRILYQKVQEDKDIKLNFDPDVKITKKELISLDESSRKFGCSPSKNTDTKSQNAVKTKDPSKYLHRCAGGHLHLGEDTTGNGNPTVNKILKTQPERIVKMLDIIVGNTCVLIDKDKGNKERRKIYGKAGEFRTPEYGVEYRTLSNFWLRSYPLMAFVMGMARLAVNIVGHSSEENDLEKEILSKIDMKDIQKAINKNDWKLAKRNFDKIKDILNNIAINSSDNPLAGTRLRAFEHFITKDLKYWFPNDPFQHWVSLPEAHSGGWETFTDKIQEQIPK